jgi:hypothetical protein
MDSSAPKGESNLYGNPLGRPTENINFPYATEFNKNTLMKHFTDHKDDVGASDIYDYEEMAILFANDVNNITHDSFVDENGSTYKFSYETYEFASILKSGVIITYYIPENGEVYWENVRRKHGK